MSPGTYAFCGRHWFMVPPELRTRIWRLFETAQWSDEHLQALDQAKQAIEAQEPERK
jgi:hypothetical protein